uniref:Uncharacterized protein n=1 Tax=Rhizophora mucronata TaxID=61149 RepID=A0A2P2MWX0_RHIMU
MHHHYRHHHHNSQHQPPPMSSHQLIPQFFWQPTRAQESMKIPQVISFSNPRRQLLQIGAPRNIYGLQTMQFT